MSLARSMTKMSKRLMTLPLRWISSRRQKWNNWTGSREDREVTSVEKLNEIAHELKAESKRLGLSLVGITSPRKSSRFHKYEEWLANGYHGEMDYMSREDRVARRGDPSLILPRVQSVIMVGMLYWPGRSGFPDLHDPNFDDGNTLHNATKLKGLNTTPLDVSYAQNRGIVSSYAWGDDYHGILQERLKSLGQHLNRVAGGVGRFYVDTGAILERDFAERAGLGFVGKNSLLINPRAGSGFFIGELFSTVALPLDGDADRGTMRRQRGEPGCGKCTKCKVACPTGAIIEDHVVDARKCISYLTIELRGRIPLELRKGMGNRVYGCDICQQVCPWNRIDWERNASTGRQGKGGYSPLFGYANEDLTTPKLTELVGLNEKGFRKRFERSAVRRIGRERMARNAAVALGNVGGEAELRVVERVAESDESELVREHASWAAKQIRDRLCDNDG